MTPGRAANDEALETCSAEQRAQGLASMRALMSEVCDEAARAKAAAAQAERVERAGGVQNTYGSPAPSTARSAALSRSRTTRTTKPSPTAATTWLELAAASKAATTRSG